MDVAVALPSVHAALSLFAEAVVGEPVAVDAGEAAACWPAVPVDAAAGRVVVPEALDDRLDFRARTLHQLVAIEDAAGDLPVDRAALAREHPWLPAAFAWLEDARIASIAARRYPGAVAELDRCRRAAGWVDLPQMLLALRRRCLGLDSSASTDPELQALIDHSVAVAQRVEATRDDSYESAVALLRAAGPLITARNDAPGSEGQLPDGLESEGTGSALDSSATPDEFEDRDGIAGGSVVDDDMNGEHTGAADENDDEPLAGLVLPVRGSRAGADVRTYVYDEWDFRAGAHRTAWCRVLEERLTGDDPSFIADVRNRHRALRSEVRRRFSRLRPEQLVRVPRSVDGEELDLDAAIEAIIDRRSGAPVDDRLQVRRDRAARDVATLFLVDLSASTSSPVEIADPEPAPPVDPEDDPLSYAPIWDPDLPPPEPPRRVIDVAKDAVALMSDALTELGDRHAIYGFSGTGRENVQVQVAKGLDDPASPATWAAVDAMRPLRYTRMGPAVRHATAKLAADAARTRLLIVISDGYPQDVDYGEDARDRDYGMHDTARALADAEAAGIDTFCLTIDPAGHDYLREMAPERRYLVIDDVEALPAELAKVYFELSR